jgi:LAO/AO transport system kinase
LEQKEQITALSVQKGVATPSNINPSLLSKKIMVKRKEYDAATYIEGILSGNRILLSQAITLIESNNPQHQGIAKEIIKACLPYTDKSIRIGITGTPGVGKSTFIEAFGQYIIEKGHKVAVLAIDPSSQRTKGSILGDKTRMQYLAINDNAFVRPSPAGNSLGGVARKTRESIMLCEAAGFDTIIIETVGVGQSETAVQAMVDFFLLLLLPGAGDELQGIKRGIVEMADLIAINKADEDRLLLAKQAKMAYQNALRLFPTKESRWLPQAVMCSALSKMGIDEIWQQITDYQHFTKENNFFYEQRKTQAKHWLHDSIQQQWQTFFYQNEKIKTAIAEYEKGIDRYEITPFEAADNLLKDFLK